jgi:hypothetical protein
VQAELPGALVPPDGRYVVRGHAGEPTHVLVVQSLLATRAGTARLGRRRTRAAPPEPPPAEVPVTRVTLVGAEPFAGEDAARAWLDGADGEREAATAFDVLRRVLHAHRIASADPSVAEPVREQALVVRLGLGEGEQVADGRWTSAVELPPPPARRRGGRRAALHPRSAWPRCSAAATPRWPARSSRCAPAPTSTPAARAKRPSRSVWRSRPRWPSSCRGPSATTSPRVWRSCARSAQPSATPRTRRSKAA